MEKREVIISKTGDLAEADLSLIYQTNHLKKKTRKQLLKDAWIVFSTFIKKRDTDWRGYGRCISCDKVLNVEENPNECHAGHYEHGHQKECYYDPENVHLQCRQCNYFGGERIIKRYTMKLISLLGIEKVVKLQNSKTKYWKNNELEQVIQFYKDKLNT